MKDSWYELRRFTQARIAQGRVGCATPTSAQLEFQLAHAMARDAVLQPWQPEPLTAALTSQGWETLELATQIGNRQQYLQRPDLGRRLDQFSRELLKSRDSPVNDVALIVSNGLSSTAVDSHGLPLVKAILATFRNRAIGVEPICLVPNARVAVADEIGALLHAKSSVIILGERPGLSAVDSLGIYLTYAPNQYNTDAKRNCISNIRPPFGLDYQTAATKLAYLTQQALERQISGVILKDDMPNGCLETSTSAN